MSDGPTVVVGVVNGKGQAGKIARWIDEWRLEPTDVDWNEIVNKPSTYPPDPHTHMINVGDGSTTVITLQTDDETLNFTVDSPLLISFDDATNTIHFSIDLSDYYTKAEADSRFVNVTGDTINGNLTVNGKLEVNYDGTDYYPVVITNVNSYCYVQLGDGSNSKYIGFKVLSDDGTDHFLMFNNETKEWKVYIDGGGSDDVYFRIGKGYVWTTNQLRVGSDSFYIKNNGYNFHFQTPYGYGTFGPRNTGWCHFETDRPSFWFNKKITINGNVEPYSDNQYSLGTSSKKWNNAYVTWLYLYRRLAMSVSTPDYGIDLFRVKDYAEGSSGIDWVLFKGWGDKRWELALYDVSASKWHWARLTCRNYGGSLRIGINAYPDNSYSLRVGGNLWVTGSLRVDGSKNAFVKSRSQPDNDELRIPCAALESPFFSGIYYTTKVKTQDKRAIVELPNYFLETVDPSTIQVFLQPINCLALATYSLTEDNKIEIKTSDDCEVNVLVIARRWDIKDEEDKEKEEWLGKYEGSQ
ncbi:MAG: hypothetical protein J7J51_05210 [Candidatus Omnitrophica bacterium]|nr:hypothetical protein [Candidatus Omnitrophota bacterium]